MRAKNSAPQPSPQTIDLTFFVAEIDIRVWLVPLTQGSYEELFGSVMPYGLDEHANPVFLISAMATHTQNVQADSRSSLLVTQSHSIGDPLGASRVTLLGNILPVPTLEVAEARELYLARYANSKYWVDFDDFSFYGWTWWTFTT
jgi:heme iron utilization protein